MRCPLTAAPDLSRVRQSRVLSAGTDSGVRMQSSWGRINEIIRVRWTVEVRVKNDGETKSRVSDERLEAFAFEKVDSPKSGLKDGEYIGTRLPGRRFYT